MNSKKVLAIGKINGNKSQDVRKTAEVKLLHGVNKVDYRRSGKQ